MAPTSDVHDSSAMTGPAPKRAAESVEPPCSVERPSGESSAERARPRGELDFLITTLVPKSAANGGLKVEDPMTTRGFLACSGTVLVLGSTVFAQGTFPPAGIDTFPSSSLFSVTIRGTVYSTVVSDPGTIIGRSGTVTEATEGAAPVPTGPCPHCQGTVADSDMSCFPGGFGGPGPRREVHGEMLKLQLCGIAGSAVVCYLAGEPAWQALNSVGGAAHYMNTVGEIESTNMTGDPTMDFPANSFWDVRGVVTITPAPAGTSGVFYTTVPILMGKPGLTSFPPPPAAFYLPIAGTTLEGGGASCGPLPVPLFDAVSSALVGMINSGAQHVVDTPPPPGSLGEPICEPGQNGVSSCPCGNPPSGNTTGCNNSSSTGGAFLSATGTSSLSSDTVVFTCTGEKPTALSIVIQGTALTNMIFGQGVRCTGGVLKRLYVKAASGGTITAPQGGDPSVSSRSASLGDTIPPGATRYYQVYYRDPVVLGGCPSSSTFNISQGLAIAWLA
jgi:hypothetical protein